MSGYILNGAIVLSMILFALISAVDVLRMHKYSSKKSSKDLESLNINNSIKEDFNKSLVKLNFSEAPSEKLAEEIKNMHIVGENYSVMANGSVRMAGNIIGSVDSILSEEKEIIFP